MALKKFRPITPTLRHTVVPDFAELTQSRPVKALTERLLQDAAAATTRATSRRAGSAAGTSAATGSSTSAATRTAIPAAVASIEYDPNRSARIALLNYADGEKRYIVAPDGLKVGDEGAVGRRRRDQHGQLPAAAATSRSAPSSTTSSCSRAAARASRARPGTYCQLMAKEGDYAQLRLPSGEVRKFHVDCRARDRAGRQPRSREHRRSARPGATAGAARAPQRPRRGHEPGRPSDGRRRRQVLGRAAPVLAVGQAGQGTQDAEAQAERPAHRAPAEEVAGETLHGAFDQEGTVRRRVPREEDRGAEPERREARAQDLGAALARSCPSSWATRSRCTTATSSSRSTSPRTWSGTSSASSSRRGSSAATGQHVARRRRVPGTEPDGSRSHGSESHPAVRADHAAQGNQVLDLIRGQARGERPRPRCSSRPSTARRIVQKVLKSAVANAAHTRARCGVEDLYVKEAVVGRGPHDQALAAARAGARHPDPEAHEPHHVAVGRVATSGVEQPVGQKTHPIGLRLGHRQDLGLALVRASADYAELLKEDMLIKRYLKKRLYQAGISQDHRSSARATRSPIDITTARPGLVIGRKGEQVDKLSRRAAARSPRRTSSSTSRRSSAPTSTPSSWPSTSPSSSSSASRSAAP